jgi:hypothetical protein
VAQTKQAVRENSMVGRKMASLRYSMSGMASFYFTFTLSA